MSSSVEEVESIMKWMDNLSKNHIEIPKVAGPPTWRYLHTLAKLTAPDRGSQLAAFQTVRQVILTFPCSTCAEHGTAYIDSHPFEGNLAQYICDFHNSVNQNLGKPRHSCDISFEQNTEEKNPALFNSLQPKNTKLDSDREKEMALEEELPYNIPYVGPDFGISFPTSPLPGAPSISVGFGADLPWTIFPIPPATLRLISEPWFHVPPLTPREHLMTMFDEEETEENAAE